MQPVALRWQWPSSAVFAVLCTTVVFGLSGFWRLPYLIDTYGGGAFLLVYVAALLVLGLPLISAQLFLARGTGADLPGILARWVRTGSHARMWVWSGALAIVGAALLLACYSVVAGWAMAYDLRAASGTLANLDSVQAKQAFHALAGAAERGFGWQLVFLGFVVATAACGLRRGVLPVLRTLAILIGLILVVLFVVVLRLPGAAEAMRGVFVPDFSAVGWRGVLEALYQAFFALSLGTGVILALGSYLPKQAPVVRVALGMLCLDLVAAVLATVILAGIVNDNSALLGSYGLEGLFIVLPAALTARWQLMLMFMLIVLVALAAAIGLFEPIVRLLQCRLRLSRMRSSVYAGIGIWLIALPSLLSAGVLSDVRWHDMALFDGLLAVSTHIVLPVTGVLLCLLTGRILSRRHLAHAWQPHAAVLGWRGFTVWHVSLRYPVRVAVLVVLFHALGGVAFVQWLWG